MYDATYLAALSLVASFKCTVLQCHAAGRIGLNGENVARGGEAMGEVPEEGLPIPEAR